MSENLFNSFEHRARLVNVDPPVPVGLKVQTVTLAVLENLVCLVPE